MPNPLPVSKIALPDTVSPVHTGKQKTPNEPLVPPWMVLPDTVPCTVLVTYTPMKQSAIELPLTSTVAAFAYKQLAPGLIGATVVVFTVTVEVAVRLKPSLSKLRTLESVTVTLVALFAETGMPVPQYPPLPLLM